MSSIQEETDQFDANLVLKDRINYPYLISNQILTIQKAIQNPEASAFQIREAVLSLLAMIPTIWEDEDFRKAMDKATIKVKVDNRANLGFCGSPPSLETCKELGIKAFTIKKSMNYYSAFHAAIDLFQRRGMLSKKLLTEKFTGKRYKGEGQDISETFTPEF